MLLNKDILCLWMQLMDIIFIRGLSIPSIIGIYSWERSCFQKLVFDLDIGYRRVNVCGSMNIDDYYLDYQKISCFVSKLVAANHFFLLESVAESIATSLMLKFNISWIRVKISKIGAIANGVDAGVIIERGMKYT